MRRSYLVSTGIALLITSSLLSQKNTENLKGLDEEILSIMNAYKAVGVSIAIVKQDKIIYTKGYGYRDHEKKLPVTANTVFPIGSNTKPFTAALIGQLQDKQKLSLKERPAAYIPGLTFSNDQMNTLITIEDLLTHRSGIGNADGSYILFPARNRLELMKRFAYLQPGGEPRNSWIYSNMGYILLGAIAEQVEQDTWDNLIRKKWFAPLKMAHSSTSIDEMLQTNDYAQPYGVYHNNIEKLLYQRPENDKPGAAINSTAGDMGNWISMWLNNGKFQQQALLSPDYVKNAISMKAVIYGAPPENADQKSFLPGYGYGWFTRIYNGHFRADHGGAVSGFSSNVILFPVEKIGIVVLTNQQNSALPYNIASMIANRMLGLDGNKPYKYEMERYDIVKPDNKILPLNQDKKPTHSLNDYCGKYSANGFGTMEIKQEGDNLFALFPAFKFRLQHKQFNTFQLKLTEDIPQQMNPDFEFNFIIGNDGNISSLTMDLNEGITFKKDTQEKK